MHQCVHTHVTVDAESCAIHILRTPSCLTTGGVSRSLLILGAGHGGPGAAAFVNENLLNTLLSHEKFDTDLKTALSEFPTCRTARERLCATHS